MMMSCDFCARGEPGVWIYPAHDVPMASSVRSTGDWYACAACHGFLAAGDLAGLEAHATAVLAGRFPDMAVDVVRACVVDAHRAFTSARFGEPRPYLPGP